MSSHHIIRDKQEPALIIANGEACSSEILNQLLEWSPFVVVLDGAIDRVLDFGIKVDVLFGDFDHHLEKLEDIKKVQFPIEVIHAPDQDKTDLEKALDFLIERDFPAVNIVWATGRRADHNFANITNLVKYSNKLQLKIIDDYSVIYPIPPLPSKFIKWFKAKTPLSLIPIYEAKDIHTYNLKYPLKNEDLILGIRIGNSNEVLFDGNVEISYHSGAMLIMECND
jgi:thiamine pyrophosphokinase